MSISSIKKLGLRGSKGKLLENTIDDEIYIGGSFGASGGFDYEYISGFVSVDETGVFDNSFSSQPYGFSSNAPNIVNVCKQQPDGKVLLGGTSVSFSKSTTISSGAATRLIRLNSDSTIDTTFFSHLNPSFGSFNDVVTDISVQIDSKIICVGNFQSGIEPIKANRIIRLNSDGTVDSSFNIGTGFAGSGNNPIRVVEVLPDGKVLVGSNFTTYNNISVTRLLRLNSDGSIDNTFNIGTGPSSTVTCIEFQSDGKMLVGGLFTTFNGVTVNRIVRLNTDLSIDDTFRINTGTGFGSDVETIAIQSDGKILVGGNFTSFNGVTTNRLVRLNEDGSRDSSFIIGSGFSNRVRKINLEVANKILVGGLYTAYKGTIFNRIVALTYTGDVDDTFDVGFGISLVSENNTTYGVYDILKLNNGKILIVGGEFVSYKGNIYDRKFLKLNNNLEIDRNYQQKVLQFYSFSIFAGSINDIKIQSDGKILVAGDGTDFSLVRIYQDGKRDGSLVATLNDGIFSIDTQNDGTIIIGGPFTTINSISSNRIGRLQLNGIRDSTFNVGSGSNNDVNVVKVIDDAILAGGLFTQYSGSTANRIVKINSNGTIDNTFNTGTGFGSDVETIAIQSDGKILVGGNFTSFNGTTVNRIARLNTDGTIDNTFSVGTGANSTVWSIHIDVDEKILVGGSFSSFNGVSNRSYIVRLLNDGSVDNTFQTHIAMFSGQGVYSINTMSDNTILIGGHIKGFSDKIRDGIVTLNSNGLIRDLKFHANPVFNSDSRSNSTSGINVITVKK